VLLRSLVRPMAACLFFVAGMVAGSAARARLPTAAEVQLASAHARKGRVHFDAGRYQEAVQEYEAAYKLAPAPQLQYGIAEAHRLNDADQLAIAAYRRYLELAPDGPEARNAHRHLRELGAEKRAPKGARPTTATAGIVPKPKPAPPPEPPSPLPPEPAPPPSSVELSTPPPAKPARAPLSERNRWIIIGTSAGAAAVIVLGVGLGVGLRPHETMFMEVRP
jgi:tetratricopeptide (TPR) repeat protein